MAYRFPRRRSSLSVLAWYIPLTMSCATLARVPIIDSFARCRGAAHVSVVSANAGIAQGGKGAFRAVWSCIEQRRKVVYRRSRLSLVSKTANHAVFRDIYSMEGRPSVSHLTFSLSSGFLCSFFAPLFPCLPLTLISFLMITHLSATMLPLLYTALFSGTSVLSAPTKATSPGTLYCASTRFCK